MIFLMKFAFWFSLAVCATGFHPAVFHSNDYVVLHAADKILDVVGIQQLPLTGRKVILPNWPYTTTPSPIKDEIEKKIAKVLVKRGEYVSGINLSDKRVCEILDVLGVETETRYYMTLNQALSLRKQLLVAKLSTTTWKLKESIGKLLGLYERGRSICDIAVDFDYPPVAILRGILAQRAAAMWPTIDYSDIKEVVKFGLRLDSDSQSQVRARDDTKPMSWREENSALNLERAKSLLSSNDLLQLSAAKKADQTSFSEENLEEREISLGWERSLYEYLDENGVQYLDEEATKSKGFRSTPDCILLDDVYINGQLVRWIDMKCFYGSARSSVYLSQLRAQTNKYCTAFNGGGAVVYRLGFSCDLQSKLKSMPVLLLNKGLLRTTDEVTE